MPPPSYVMYNWKPVHNNINMLLVGTQLCLRDQKRKNKRGWSCWITTWDPWAAQQKNQCRAASRYRFERMKNRKGVKDTQTQERSKWIGQAWQCKKGCLFSVQQCSAFRTPNQTCPRPVDGYTHTHTHTLATFQVISQAAQEERIGLRDPHAQKHWTLSERSQFVLM